MSAIYLPILALIAGILGLLWGADRFVAGSAGAARNFGVSPMVIGLTLVSVGTSAPEIIVSINAALSNAGEMAVGNSGQYRSGAGYHCPGCASAGTKTPFEGREPGSFTDHGARWIMPLQRLFGTR